MNTYNIISNLESRKAMLLTKVVVEYLKGECVHRLVFSQHVFPSKDGKRPANIRTAWESVIANYRPSNLIVSKELFCKPNKGFTTTTSFEDTRKISDDY